MSFLQAFGAFCLVAGIIIGIVALYAYDKSVRSGNKFRAPDLIATVVLGLIAFGAYELKLI